MSIMNITVSRLGALVAVDTEGVVQSTGQRGRIDKLFTVPTLGAVLALRGNAGFGNALWQALHRDFSIRSFDDVLAEAPARLVEAVHTLRKMAEQAGVTVPQACSLQQVALVGPSRLRRRVIAAVFELDVLSHDPVPRRTELGDGDVWIGPCEPSFERLAEPDDIEDLRRLYAAQVAWIRANHPRAAGGGPMVCAEVTEGRLSIGVDR